MAKIEPVGLYLIVEAMPGPSVQERLKATLAATKFASALICAPRGQTLDAATARPFVELIQAQDVAALIDNDAQLARTLRADGVHLRAGDDLEARATEAREILGTRYIIGGEAQTRHDAMMLGEQGAEYVAFASLDGSPEQAGFVEWWAQIFEVPCIAFDVPTPQDATTMASLGADFVAFRLISAGTPGDAQDSARSFADAAAVGLQEFASRSTE